MKKFLKYGMTAATLIALAACGKSGKDTAQDLENKGNGTLTAAGLQGVTYTSDCQNVPLDVLNLNAFKVQYKFDGDFKKITTYYSDNQCLQSEILVITEGGTLAPHDTVNGDSLTVRADLDLKTTTVQPKTDELKNAMNALPGLPGQPGGYCGINNWGLDSKDVSADSGALNCLGTDKLNQVDYDIINTANSELHLGLATPGHDKTTPDQRPTTIDPKVLGKRQ